ncbi:glycosyltransferase family 2 protein [Thermogymnomonas acidicola]|uniref:glycosyltransferase family 2 protein n=1 Tax=Thermogymnomonas acidicola TaxID=399579 RepID=UPI0009465028|nr:glycosyltransferase [Thermogymnomonas acidicola]
MSERDVTVIIPAYNEEDRIGKTLRDLIDNMDTLARVIVVVDGNDRTEEIARSFGPHGPGLQGREEAGQGRGGSAQGPGAGGDGKDMLHRRRWLHSVVRGQEAHRYAWKRHGDDRWLQVDEGFQGEEKGATAEHNSGQNVPLPELPDPGNKGQGHPVWHEVHDEGPCKGARQEGGSQG